MRQRRPLPDAAARSRSARDSRSRNGAGAGCRTPRHKTHSTAAAEELAVAYSWHPWAERTVRVHEVIERPTGAVARCSLVGAAVARGQDIPVWMLDAAAWLSDSTGSESSCGVVRPCRFADPAFGSDADRGNRAAVRCRDSISRFLSWRSSCNTFVAGPDCRSINSIFGW